ncbi:hypothetical protein VKT23_002493 [Stygiomarasmius scandens]|uniref:MARVEL domain-containing protein n=1 Tax=Marasmiellus scandens TaxID=2682957 RepID=A0ABR1K7Q0_9AGAR
MSSLSSFRLAVLATCVVFALIVLGLAAHMKHFTDGLDLRGAPEKLPLDYEGLAIATAILTLITLPVMIALDAVHKGKVFTSKVVVELVWLGILWVLWVATAAQSVVSFNKIFEGVGCDPDKLGGVLITFCRETQATAAFGFLIWIALFFYTLVLLAFSIRAADRGSSVWFSGVAESKDRSGYA